MKVFCTLPLNGAKPQLVKSLAAANVSPLFRINRADELLSLYQLAVLAQVSQESIAVNLPCWLIESSEGLLDLCSDYNFKTIIISGWLGLNFKELFSFPAVRARRIGLEVLDSNELDIQELDDYPIDFLVLKGHEAGGVVGSDHTHMLFHSVRQRLVQRKVQLYLEGGIGIEGAGILTLLGASGVVITDQIKYAIDYPPSQASHRRTIGAHETLAVQFCQEYYVRIPRTFGQGLQQTVESKIASCYPLQSARANSGLVIRKLSELGIDPSVLHFECIGQDAGFALEYSKKYGDIVSIALAYATADAEALLSLDLMIKSKRLVDGNFSSDLSLATDLMQGPMTRVSDVPEFIAAVADGGALPFFAAAMLSPDTLRDKLKRTKALLGGNSWGVGLLGFLPRDIRDQQFKVVKEISPPYVLIAGGRPDQAEDFERAGISAFIHAPTLDLFQQYIADGATNLILEGRECGGHVGPVGSLVLWEQCLSWLAEASLPHKYSHYHIVLAGGIADPPSCSTARLLSFRAKLLGIRIGILTGTPYLYTDEAVSTNAIIESYRETVISAFTTVNLETGAGHASRCAVTPFTHEFQQLKNNYISEGLSGYQLREELEKLTLGRLRLATKGLKRDSSGIVSVSQEESYRDGMYMLGQSAALLGEKTTIAELHHRLTNGTVDYLLHLAEQTAKSSINASRAACRVAIVAMDCMMPDSTDVNRFWDILFSGEDVVKEVPKDRWDPALYYSSEKNDLDRVYSKWGGFLPSIDIDTGRLGIPPVSLKKIEPLQILTLELVTRLFEKTAIRFDQDVRDRTCVFLGAGGGIGDMGGKYAARSEIERIVDTDKANIYSRLPEWGDETFPGLLFNVVAGRVANRLNLKGASFTVDAACASSLAAVYAAFRELDSFNCDLAIAGGVDTGQSPFAFLCFSRSQALSPTGRSRSFDQEANGIAISEGLGIIVMKRLDDALRDGDPIVAVIDGVGAASDGRGSSLTSPQTTGQQLAVERAWRSADCSPACMSLYEAHGTGTVAGDRTEIETVVATMRRHSASPQACAVSSTKPNIGHTKSSAGIAGLMHASLCIQHRVLSPQIGATKPLELLTDPLSPIFLNQSSSFWPSPLHGRKAGVSAFGFGGTNYHIVLSEPPVRSQYLSTWPKTSSYLFTWHSSDIERLRSEISDFARAIRTSNEASLHQLSYLHCCQAKRSANNELDEYRASIVASTANQLLGKLDLIISASTPKQTVNRLDDSTFLAHCSSGHSQRRVVLLLPGQGALREQYLDELLVAIDPVKDSLDTAVSSGSVGSRFLCDLLLKRSSSDSHNANIGLISMAELQPLICAIQLGLCDALLSFGLRPDMVIGHSLGEFTATALSGLWAQRDLFFQLIRERGTQMDIACHDLDSGMLATSLTDPDQLSLILQDCGATHISNYNSPRQITISGPIGELERIAPRIKSTGEKATRLNVTGAFHSPMMQQASDAFAEQLATYKLHPPALKVLSLVDSNFYSADVSESLSRLKRHMTASVNLVDGINALDRQPHIFINIGPSKTLDKLVKEIRIKSEDVFISLDDGNNDIGGYYKSLAHLFCLLPEFCPDLGRSIVPATRQFECKKSSLQSAVVSNGMAYMAGDVPHPSSRPPLTADSAAVEAHLPSMKTEPATMGFPQSSPLASSTHEQETSPNSVSSLLPFAMTPLNHNTYVQVFSIYSENIRQFLASQERVTMALLSTSEADSISESSALPAFAPTSLSPASVAPSGVAASQNPFAGLELAFIDPVLHSEGLSQDSKPSSTPAAYPIPMSSNAAATESGVPVPLVEVDHPSKNRLSAPPDFASLLIDITSDLTGYPLDMLQPELALEADLGIDSIKRVEIFARLQKAVSTDLRELIKSKTDDLAAAPRIVDIIDILSALLVPSGK